jgi:phosphomannomutase/phosphoglucomutase
MYRTGHSLIKAKMKEEQAELAGEMSGHMFFKDRYFGFDDATLCGVQINRDCG